MNNNQEKVIKYYNKVQKSYDTRWMNKDNLAMHLGFWDKDTKSLHEALLNQNKYVADALEINHEDLVLDAGCGVGGTAIWIAENYSAMVMGVNIVEKQIESAKKYALERGVDNKVDFEIKDYAKTGFKDESFTKIYAIESICHSENKEAVIKEAYRLLKRGGKFVIIDAFIKNNNISDRGKKLLRDWYEGWVCPDLAFLDTFRSILKNVGFKELKNYDVTEMIIPSSKFLYKHCSKKLLIKKIFNKIGLISNENFGNTRASISQHHLYKENFILHYLLVVQK